MELQDLLGPARRIAVGVSSLALVLGAAACTGRDEEQPTPTVAPEPTASRSTPAPGDGDGAVSDEDLAAATDRFLAFLTVMDDQDWESVCTYVLDPGTGTAPEGERLQECADDAREVMGEYEHLLQPGAFDRVDASMVTAEPREDGTVALSVLELGVDVPMARGDDGQWYLSIPF